MGWRVGKLLCGGVMVKSNYEQCGVGAFIYRITEFRCKGLLFLA